MKDDIDTNQWTILMWMFSQGHTGTDVNVWTLTLETWQMSCGRALTNSEYDIRIVTGCWALITHGFLRLPCLHSALQETKSAWPVAHFSVMWVCVCARAYVTHSQSHLIAEAWLTWVQINNCVRWLFWTLKSDKVEDYTLCKTRMCWELFLPSGQTKTQNQSSEPVNKNNPRNSLWFCFPFLVISYWLHGYLLHLPPQIWLAAFLCSVRLSADDNPGYLVTNGPHDI